MVRQVLRLAVAVLAQLDNDEGDDVVAPDTTNSQRAARARRATDTQRVRPWDDEPEEDWLFIHNPEEF